MFFIALYINEQLTSVLASENESLFVLSFILAWWIFHFLLFAEPKDYVASKISDDIKKFIPELSKILDKGAGLGLDIKIGKEVSHKYQYLTVSFKKKSVKDTEAILETRNKILKLIKKINNKLRKAKDRNLEVSIDIKYFGPKEMKRNRISLPYRYRFIVETEKKQVTNSCISQRVPYYSKIDENNINIYQKYFEKIIKNVHVGNFTKWSLNHEYDKKQLERDNKVIIRYIDEATDIGLNSKYLKMIVFQYFFADVIAREINKSEWVSTVINIHKQGNRSFFPPALQLEKTLFLSNLINYKNEYLFRQQPNF